MRGNTIKTKWLPFVLLASNIVVALGILFDCRTTILQMGSLMLNTVSPLSTEGIRLTMVNVGRIVTDLVVLCAFIWFTYIVVHRGAVFGKPQTRCLLVVGVSLLLRTALGLALPWLRLGEAAGGLIGPTLDLRLLAFSFMFFAFAGIFEYGRILQEDSDNIL